MNKLDFKLPEKRLSGFTMPCKDGFHICGTDEVYFISLEDQRANVIETNFDPFNFFMSAETFLGAQGMKPITSFGNNTLDYTFDPTKREVVIRFIIDGESGELIFPTLSGDWFVASFSTCGKFLAVAEPYQIDLYRL